MNKAAAQAKLLAEQERQRAYEAFLDAAQTAAAHSRDTSPFPGRVMHVPADAFNALSMVGLATTLATVIWSATNSISAEIRRVHGELANQTDAMIGGYSESGFSEFIYQFIGTEIKDYRRSTAIEGHRFHVYSPITLSDVVFKKKNQETPLPASFGGFSSDLEVVFVTM
jgi:hypothetical protein